MNIAVQEGRDSFHIFVAGEIDVYTASELKHHLLPLTRVHDVVLDLNGTSYMDSTALGVIIAALKGAVQSDHRFQIVGLTPQVERLFRITGLTEILQREKAIGGNDNVRE